MNYDRFRRWNPNWSLPYLVSLQISLVASAGTVRFTLNTGTTQFSDSKYAEFRVAGTSPFAANNMTYYAPGAWGGHPGGYVVDSELTAGTAYEWRANLATGPGGVNWISALHSFTTPSDGSFFEAPMAYLVPPAASWHLDEIIRNESTVARKYALDTDCDGIADTHFVIPAGGSHRLQIESDQAPCGDITVAVETYLGDAQWGFEEVTTIDADRWNEDSPPPTPGTNSITAPLPQPDTRSQTNALVSFPTPSTNAVADNTFRTGVEAIRTAQIEKSQEIVEAIDKLRQATTNALGQGFDTNSTFGHMLSRAAFASNSVQSALLGFTNVWRTNFGPNIATGAKPPTTRLRVALGTDARWGAISIDPDDYPVLTAFLSFGKSACTWCLWILYGYWLLHTITESLKLAAGTPSQPSASQLPGVSWLLAVGAAVAVALIITALGVASMAVVIAELQSAAWAGANDWRAWEFLAEAIWWGDQFVPLTLVFGLALSIPATKLTVDATTLATMAAIRGTTA